MSKASACLLVAVIVGLSTRFLPTLSGDEKGGASKERLFEMRTYTTAPGKLDGLHARFRDHTNKLFQKHGMTLIGYWTPAEGEGAKNTLVYILAYPDKEAREKAWKAFQDDPEWKKARADSEVNGALVAKVESVFLKPTDYSPIR
jgi:hypothetical protein